MAQARPTDDVTGLALAEVESTDVAASEKISRYRVLLGIAHTGFGRVSMAVARLLHGGAVPCRKPTSSPSAPHAWSLQFNRRRLLGAICSRLPLRPCTGR